MKNITANMLKCISLVVVMICALSSVFITPNFESSS